LGLRQFSPLARQLDVFTKQGKCLLLRGKLWLFLMPSLDTVLTFCEVKGCFSVLFLFVMFCALPWAGAYFSLSTVDFAQSCLLYEPCNRLITLSCSFFGKTNRVYEILNGKRSLILPMIWNLHRMFGISAESLIRPPAV